MLSSTSNSEIRVRLPRIKASPAILLMASLAMLMGTFEVATRTVIERRSKVQRMVNKEYTEAIHIRRAVGGNSSGPKQLLVVGNSLVDFGINFDQFKRGLPPEWQAHRFWIYNTGYSDWYFGLRRLFADGSRPDAVAIVFAGLNWYSNGIRGDYSSQYLFQTQDLLRISSEANLNRTETSSLLFARYSKFYALRSDIRKVLLNSILPDLPQMYTLFRPGSAPRFTEQQLIPLVTERIIAYRSIVETYGSKLILIVPPVPHPGEEYQRAIRISAGNAGVRVVMPMSCSDVPLTDFLDDIHLAPEGAKLYTSQVVKALPAALTDPRL